jgi:large subunit ribosomal protein L4e
MRGRRYRTPRGPLVVVRDAAKARHGFGNLPGVEVVTPAALNAEVLAPGGDPGRLTIFSASALDVVRGWAA